VSAPLNEHWIIIRAEQGYSTLWDTQGFVVEIDTLPAIPETLAAGIAAFEHLYSALDDANATCPGPLYSEQAAEASVAEFNAQGRAVAHALKPALPPDWTVVYKDVDAWLRPEGLSLEARQWILPGVPAFPLDM
jgi:hypothetical protein